VLRQGNTEAERVLAYKLDTVWKSDCGAGYAAGVRLNF